MVRGFKNMIKSSQAAGWLLLVLGIGIILWTLYSSYNIFTGNVPIPEVFKMEQSIGQAVESPNQPEAQKQKLDAPQDQIEQMLQEQIKNILPSIPNNTITTFLNLSSWSMLAWLMIFGASRISSIGIKLIKQDKPV